MANLALGRLTGLIRLVFSAEELDELPVAASVRPRRSLFGLITASEELPKDILAPAGDGHLLSRLFRSEHLPFDPHSSGTGRASFLGTLFSRERLPEEPVPGPGEKNRPRRGGA